MRASGIIAPHRSALAAVAFTLRRSLPNSRVREWIRSVYVEYDGERLRRYYR